MIDAEGQPFHDPEADAALFAAVRRGAQCRAGGDGRNVNDEAFAEAMADRLDSYLRWRVTGDEARASCARRSPAAA